MKRIAGLFLSFVLLFALTACGGEVSPTVPDVPTAAATQTPAAGLPEQTDAPTQPPVPLDAMLVDNEACSFRVDLASVSEHAGMSLSALCANKTGSTLMFTWNMVSVCGYMYDPAWSEEVAPGETVSSAIELDTFELEQYGITSVDEVEFTLLVFNAEDFMAQPYVEEQFTVYPTGATAETVSRPEYQHKNGETVILDSETLCFIIESVDDEVSDFYTLRCYGENRTEQNLILSWDSVTVNGENVDPVWSVTIAAGKQIMAEINFPASELDAAGIDTVTEIRFTLTAADYDDWEADPILSESCTFDP